MPLGIRPINDFAFKKTFGTPENRPCLISLLNAIIHTLELARYNTKESELRTATMLDCWLFWLLHAHEYEPEELMKLLPEPAIRQATNTLTRISQITEDKAMYDAREKAIRDRKWEIAARERTARREGKIEGKIEGEREGEIKGEIKMVRTLQGLLGVAVAEEQELHALALEQLRAMTSDLQEKLRTRTPSQ